MKTLLSTILSIAFLVGSIVSVGSASVAQADESCDGTEKKKPEQPTPKTPPMFHDEDGKKAPKKFLGDDKEEKKIPKK